MNRPIKLPRPRRRAFTFVELMVALIIFAMVATAGTYLLAFTAKSRQYAQGTASAESEVEFTVQRITDNIRAATAVTTGASTITITSPPSPLISGGTFTITYSLAGSSLLEVYVNNATNQTYSSGVVVHNVSQFTVAALVSNPKAFQFTLSAGAGTTVPRTGVAFGRNL